jgi:hypothetical protein
VPGEDDENYDDEAMIEWLRSENEKAKAAGSTHIQYNKGKASKGGCAVLAALLVLIPPGVYGLVELL